MASRIMLLVTIGPLLKQWTFSVLGSGFGGSDVVDVGAIDVGFVDMGAVDMGAVDMGAVEVGAVEVGAVEVGAVEVGAVDVGVTLVVDSVGRNVGSFMPISSAQAWSSSSCSSS
jgi:hypothetical protein